MVSGVAGEEVDGEAEMRKRDDFQVVVRRRRKGLMGRQR